jgi:hypothetical protein
MSNEQEQMSNGSAKHIRVTARPIRDSDLESLVAVTEPSLSSQTSSKLPNKCWLKTRQLANFRQVDLSETLKNHLLRFGPTTASHASAQNFDWSSDAQDSEES